MKQTKGAKGYTRAPLRALALLLFAVVLVGAFAIGTLATGSQDEMTDIAAEFDEENLVQPTVRVEDDGYVGAIQYTVYHNKTGTIKTGYEGTPVIIYTVNHPTVTRIGTHTNVDIIRSMLNKGYVVVVLDYLGTDAGSAALALSSQAFRAELINDKIITYDGFPDGNPREVFVAPSGYNVRLGDVFWEIDKHAAYGTMDKIVENWNSDFRTAKATSVVYWRDANGERKKTLDDAVWGDLTYDSKGNRVLSVSENGDGDYTLVKYTVAETVTDCVDPDGSFIDMNLYINIVYPTSPKNEVPVMSLANSSGYPTTAITSADLRPHSNGFLYEGYANVVFDYLWEPMARNASWGYYDGSQGNTKDHMNYALMIYNDKLVNTAAMRYLRYVSLSGGSTYNFDLDAFGVYGNSKGGWFSFLGEEVLQDNLVDPTGLTTDALEEALDLRLSQFTPDRYYNGHHGETRYQVGVKEKTTDGFTVKAGARQPWLTYNGVEILSGAQLTNACNGDQQEDITEGHAPVFISGNMTDTYNAAYGYSVDVYNICRELNIPLLQFEVPIGHTLTSGQDMNYNVDTYEKYFDYVGYFLKGDAIGVAYISPMPNAGGVKVTDKITVAFTGVAERAAVESITVTGGQEAVSGVWTSSFGGVVWTFTPDALEGNKTYTVTVPASFAGNNGVAMGAAYTASFITEYDKATVLSGDGGYYSFTVPEMSQAANKMVYRFNVTNDAANVAELYALDGVSDGSGELLGSVNLRGSGTYEIDITDWAVENKGKSVTLRLCGSREANDNISVKNEIFDTVPNSEIMSTNDVVTYLAGQTVQTAGGEAVTMGVYVNTPTAKGDSVYYSNVTRVFTYKKITGGELTSVDNVGRRYVISFDVYDTVSRTLQVRLNSMTKRVPYGTIDYNNVVFNQKTVKDGKLHVEFVYEVYEPDLGFVSDSNTQSLAVYLSPTGDTNGIAYFDNLKVIEQVTDITVGSAVIAEKNDGSGEYAAPISDLPFALYSGEEKLSEHATLTEVFSNYSSGYTVRLQRDYVLTDEGLYSGFGNFAEVNIDLSGYSITSSNQSGAFIWAMAINTDKTVINLSNGAVYLDRTPLVSYGSSTSAGAGKSFDINLDGVYIGLTDYSFATEIISEASLPDGAEINVDIDLTDTVIDLPDAKRARDAAVIFPAPTSASTLEISYGITGGEIRLSSQRWISVSDNAKIVEFFKADGEYTPLKMPSSVTFSVSGSYLIANGYATYVRETESGNITTYGLELTDGSTRYGVIPEDYRDGESYPFTVFKDGVMLSAETSLKAAVAKASAALTGAENLNSVAEILVRADNVNSSEPVFGSSTGTIVIDLGEKTLTRASIFFKMEMNSSTDFDNPTSVIVKNGTLRTNGGAMGATHNQLNTTDEKTFNLSFEGVTLGFSSSFSASSITEPFYSIWQNSGTKGNTPSITNLTYTDCTFDLDTNGPASGGRLFSLATAVAKVNLKIMGGSLVTNAASYTLAATDSADTVLIGTGSDGKYPTLKVKSGAGGASFAENLVTTVGDTTNFVSTDASEGGYDIYELETNKNVTKYGVIPNGKADATTYPFVLFSGGEFVGAYTSWNAANSGAASILQGKPDVTAELLLRRDYSNDTAANGGAINKLNGTLIVDLGGFTMIRNKLIFDLNYYSTNSDAVNIIIKNGYLRTLKFGFFANQVWCDGGTSDKVWNITLEGVTLGFASGAAACEEMFWSSWTNNETPSNVATEAGAIKHGSKTNVTFNNCTFDLKTNLPSGNINLFDFSDNNSYNLLDTNCVINGGKIISDNLAGLSLFSLNDGGTDTVTFGKYGGKYTTLEGATTADGFAHSTEGFTTAEGTRYFVEVYDDGTTSKSELLSLSYKGYGSFTPAADTAQYIFQR